MRKSQVALHVRVKFNEKWKPKCIGDEFISPNDIFYIKEPHVYNDILGDYVFVGTSTWSTTAYLDELDLEFPIETT